MRVIPVGKHYVTVVDDETYPELIRFKWNICGGSDPQLRYAATSAYPGRVGKTTYMHRLIMGLNHPEEVDHINRDGLDNRRCNLRWASRAENLQNRRGAHRQSHTGVRGVGWFKDRQKYQARVKVAGRLIHCGFYTTVEEAERAAIAARMYYMTHAERGTPDEKRSLTLGQSPHTKRVHLVEAGWALCGHDARHWSVVPSLQPTCEQCLQILTMRPWLMASA